MPGTIEQRKNVRYESSATVIIEDSNKDTAMLKDISITGCRVELPACAAVEQHKQYKLKIVPESASNIESFFLTAESKWIGAGAGSYLFGFCIVKSPTGKQFQRYVDYLSWRYSQGNSMTSDAGSGVTPII